MWLVLFFAGGYKFAWGLFLDKVPGYYKNWARTTAPPPMAKSTLAGVDERALPPLGLVGEGVTGPVVVLVTVGTPVLPEVVVIGMLVLTVEEVVTGPVVVGVALSVEPGMGLMVIMPSPEEEGAFWATATATMVARRVTVENFMIEMSKMSSY